MSSARHLVNVGCILRYANGTIQQGRFRWENTVTEKEALRRILVQLSPDELEELYVVQLSQTPAQHIARIAWMDKAPHGKYFVNQHVYDRDGCTAASLLAASSHVSATYDPDEFAPDVLGSLANVYDERPVDSAERQDNGDLLRERIQPMYNE